jgi:acyl-coenzyme A synthetase/AMP-(fatty) acid ligase
MTANTEKNEGGNHQHEWDFLLNRLAANAAKHPAKVAMAFVTPGPNGGKLSKQNTFTYLQLEQETSGLAARLLESGMVQGDR